MTILSIRKTRTKKKKVQRFKNKSSVKRKESEKIKIQAINNRVSKFFEALNLDKIAKKTGFLRRFSIITPFIFLYALSMGTFGNSISLDMLAANISSLFNISITGQALCLRMGKKSTVSFLKSAFESLLTIQLKSSFKNDFSQIFPRFKAILLEDSTAIELNESLSKKFQGSGGSASKSALKINWLFNLGLYSAVVVDIFSWNTPDQKNATKSLKYLKKRMLIIRDLGYFTFESIDLIAKKGAYYLTRLRKDVCIYLNEHDKTPIDIQAFFREITRNKGSTKIQVYIGKKERIPTCLIVQRVPKWVTNHRIKKQAEKRKVTQEFITWAKYSVFITNIPDECWETKKDVNIADLIIELYKIRWQIELLFKKLKSNIKLNIIKGKNENRVLCMVYGKLISIILSLMILSYAASKRHKGREISLWKVTNWLILENRLANAIFKDSLIQLYEELARDFKYLSKDRRKRKTSLGVIQKVYHKKEAINKDKKKEKPYLKHTRKGLDEEFIAA